MSPRDRTANASALRTQLWTANVNISNQMIHNQLHEAILCSRLAAVQPSLVQANCAACFTWAQHHLAWSRVLFTDESWFTLSFTVHPVLQWLNHLSLEMSRRVLPWCHCVGAQWLWWWTKHPCIASKGTWCISFRDDAIKPGALQALQAMGHCGIQHRAHAVNNFLQQQRATHMDWLACPPNLTPTEHLQDVLDNEHELTIL